MLQCSDALTRGVGSPASHVVYARDSAGLFGLLLRKADEHLLEGSLADAVVLDLECFLDGFDELECISEFELVVFNLKDTNNTKH
jgi:hypothetical protein